MPSAYTGGMRVYPPEARPMPEVLLRWVDDNGVFRREWVECEKGYIGRLSRGDSRIADDTLELRYGVFLVCEEPRHYLRFNVLDASVSRRHLVFRFRRRVLEVMDSGEYGRGSSNGSIVNGTVLPPGRWVAVAPTGAVGLGGLVIDYRVGGVEPGVTLVSLERGSGERVLGPGLRVYEAPWLPRIHPHGARRMGLALGVGVEPRGRPEDYEERGRFFARVARAAGDGVSAEKAVYAVAYAALVLRGYARPALDLVREEAERLATPSPPRPS